MNAIRATQKLNELELQNVTPPSASWHRDYDDTAFIYIGGLDTQLSEGDVLTIFSQYGEPVFINLARDKETGKSKGFCFLKYEDQRSCALAVDNLGGATVLGRVLRVDHTRYKVKEGEEIYDNTTGEGPAGSNGKADDTEEEESEDEPKRPLLREEKELQRLLMDEEDDDPMKAFLIQQKREEVEIARAKADRKEKKERKHRSRRDEQGKERRRRDASEDDDRVRRRHRNGDEGKERRQRDRSEEYAEKDGRRRHSSSGDEHGRSRYRKRSTSPRRSKRDDSERRKRSLSKTPVYGD